MIDLEARSVADSQKIHNGTLGAGGFNVSLKFTDLATPTPNTETIQGLYIDVSNIGINFDTGMPASGSKLWISFHQADLTIWNGTDDIQRWNLELVNGAGQTVVGEINDVKPDRSFGSVLASITIESGH